MIDILLGYCRNVSNWLGGGMGNDKGNILVSELGLVRDFKRGVFKYINFLTIL